MEENKLNWLRDLISKGNLHDFYSSVDWQNCAAQARRLQHNECQRCRRRGYYSPCDIVHHIKYVKANPELALDVDNLECLCRNCHEEEHRKKVFMNEERW